MKGIITNPKGGRRWVIADIHGCLETLKTLVEQRIILSKADQLFLLGDYINRGKHSAGVLDYLMGLIAEDYQIYPLLGNHEQMLLDAWQYNKNVNGTPEAIPLSSRMMGAYDLLDTGGDLIPTYAGFLESLAYYYELDNFYLVHAGFDFKAQNPFTDYTSMVWMRNFTDNPTAKTIIHGHQIKDLKEIKYKIETRSTIIPLDNGCYYGLSYSKEEKQRLHLENVAGNLCELKLDTFELITQHNID